MIILEGVLQRDNSGTMNRRQNPMHVRASLLTLERTHRNIYVNLGAQKITFANSGGGVTKGQFRDELSLCNTHPSIIYIIFVFTQVAEYYSTRAVYTIIDIINMAYKLNNDDNI